MEIVAEEWRAVVGEEFYEVSSLGGVRSIDRTVTYKDGVTYRKKGKVLSPRLGSNGYFNVHVGKPGTLVHSLVAAAFIGPRPIGMHINHIDGNKTNNAAANLEYVTRTENLRHAVRTGLLNTKGENNANCIAREENIRRAWQLMVDGMSVKKASELAGVSVATLWKVRRGKSWRHLGLGLITDATIR